MYNTLMEERLEKYEAFIVAVTKELARMFEYQKEYMCCKPGCSLCCETGMYPFSQLEFDYLKLGFEGLREDTKRKVISNVKEISKDYKGEHFLHCCPFLINGVCSVYQHRGIICRTHGLITENAEGKLTVPHCAGEGLNYGKVYNVETKRIDEEEVVKLGYQIMPKAYNVCRNNVMNLSLAKSLELDFGESRMLLEWILDYIAE